MLEMAAAPEVEEQAYVPTPEPIQPEDAMVDVRSTNPTPQVYSPPPPVVPTQPEVTHTGTPIRQSAFAQPLPSPATPWKPKSNFVQRALASSPAPTPPPQASNIPSPWKEQVFARELNNAEWEEEPEPQATPGRNYARELGNLNSAGWDDADDDLPPPPPSKTKTPKRTPGKTKARATQMPA